MADPTEVYVDPSIAGDSGAGTIGDPYGDLQHALDSVTRDSSNGNRFNIKAGTDEILTGILSLASYGAPGTGHPLIFQGYTSTAGDGGIGGIDGNDGDFSVHGGASYVHWRDLHLHNTGTADILKLSSFGQHVNNVEFNNTSGDGLDTGSGRGIVTQCYFHDIGGFGINKSADEVIYTYLNYFKNDGTKDFNAAIGGLGRRGVFLRNIISVDGASDGINFSSYFNTVGHNSILSAGGTGQGIVVSSTAGVDGGVHSNLVEGFSGSGGIGIQITSDLNFYANNAVYNCATDYSVTSDVFHNLADNETLSASPFAKSGADTFANRFTYFAPVDTGNVIGGAYQ